MVEITSKDKKLNSNEIYRDLKETIGLVKKSPASDQKIFIKGICFESEEYSNKFMAKNCYILHMGEYFIIKKIRNDSLKTMELQQLCIKKVSLNTVKILKEMALKKNVDVLDDLKKLVPTYVNNFIYLSIRPNFDLNE